MLFWISRGVPLMLTSKKRMSSSVVLISYFFFTTVGISVLIFCLKSSVLLASIYSNRFRKLAHKTHPAKNLTDPFAAEKFSQVAEAYEVLVDPRKRAVYDQFGEEGLKQGVPQGSGQAGAWTQGWTFHGDPHKVFYEFFGGDNPFQGMPTPTRVSLTDFCSSIDSLYYCVSRILRPRRWGSLHGVRRTCGTWEEEAGRADRAGVAGLARRGVLRVREAGEDLATRDERGRPHEFGARQDPHGGGEARLAGRDGHLVRARGRPGAQHGAGRHRVRAERQAARPVSPRGPAPHLRRARPAARRARRLHAGRPHARRAPHPRAHCGDRQVRHVRRSRQVL